MWEMAIAKAQKLVVGRQLVGRALDSMQGH
jgi:hypothetical protein